MVSVGFYGKQFVFFFAIAAFVGGGLWYVNASQTSEAATSKHVALPNTSVANLTIKVMDGGKVTVDGQRIGGLLDFMPDRDVLSYQAFSGDQSFVNQLTVTVILPRPVDQSAAIARHFGSYGVTYPDPVFATPTTVVYVAENLTPQAAYRLELVLPKGVVKPSLVGQVVDGIRYLHPGVWLGVALGLPLLASLLLALMSWQAARGWRGAAVTALAETPPTDAAPAVAGVLVNGKVSPRSLAATLLDLARRGYIQVVHRADGFSFGRRKAIDPVSLGTDPNLTQFERLLLDKIFTGEAIRSTGEDIQLRIGAHVFSRKVAESYLEMYAAAIKQGWFLENPQLVQKRWRFAALVVMAAAVAFFLLALLFGPEPYYYTLGFAGLFFVGAVMYRVTPLLPRRTGQGDRAYQAWAAFKNYLAADTPVNAKAGAQELYERYLPYAVVLGVEVEWTERFLHLPFRVPAWYASTDEIHVIEDFANNLFPIVGSVAQDLAKAREPYAV